MDKLWSHRKPSGKTQGSQFPFLGISSLPWRGTFFSPANRWVSQGKKKNKSAQHICNLKVKLWPQIWKNTIQLKNIGNGELRSAWQRALWNRDKHLLFCIWIWICVQVLIYLHWCESEEMVPSPSLLALIKMKNIPQSRCVGKTQGSFVLWVSISSLTVRLVLERS